MAHAEYYTWVSKNRPYTLILPAKHVQATIRRYGLTVYDYPNEEHQKASTPQDHTPYSVTGWPGQNTKYYARALDIMPRDDTAAAKKENANIARQFIKDRDAGHPGVSWIKYLNWTDEKGNCHHEAWQDKNNRNRRVTTSSTDRGHVHISGRSDMDDYEGAEDYDPVARMALGGGTVSVETLVANAERVLTTWSTRLMEKAGPGESSDRTGIKLDYPWTGGPTVIPNPVDWLIKQFKSLGDKMDTVITAVGAPAEPVPVEPLDYTKLAKALLTELKETQS